MIKDIRFKEGVYGFIYDSTYGDILTVIHEPITEDVHRFMSKYGNESFCLFTELSTIVEIWGLDEAIDGEWNDIVEEYYINEVK
jgi:hypothetical protein